LCLQSSLQVSKVVTATRVVRSEGRGLYEASTKLLHSCSQSTLRINEAERLSDSIIKGLCPVIYFFSTLFIGSTSLIGRIGNAFLSLFSALGNIIRTL